MNRTFITGLVTAALLCVVGTLGAQDPNYILSISGDPDASSGSSYSAAAVFDNNGADVAGWSFGVCNDTTALSLDTVDDGSATSTVKNGGAPDFNEKSTQPEGYTQGVVICFTGCSPMPPGTGYELLIGNYTAATIAPGDPDLPTTIGYCDTLGNPPVATVVVVAGASIVPTQNPLDVTVVGVPSPAFDYIAPATSANYNPAVGDWSLTDVAVVIDQADNGADDAITQGFSMGLGHDATYVSVVDVTATLPFAPDFAEVNLGLPDGWTIGVVYSFTGANTLVLQDVSVVEVDYQNSGGALVGDDVGLTTALAWNDNLGTPPVANVVVVGGGSLAADFVDGAIDLVPSITNDFVRGDANNDSIVNIADGIWILNDLFQGGPTTTDVCPIANDVNDDGLFDSSDATYIFNYRFLNGPMPPAPFPTCGTVAGQIPDDCSSARNCP